MAKIGTAATSVNTQVNYDDKRFQQVNTEKNQALNQVDQTYGQMIGDTDKYYQAQIDASKQWAEKQTEIQNQQTDFAIEKIEQEKEKAEKDYTKEQSGAYVDWQKQSGRYGVKAEQMAASGMTNTGYSESSQVAMYNTYQMRVATAREGFNNAILNYNNAIKDARLQNNSALAEIAYKALQQQLELALQGFQYKNQLLLDKANKKLEVENNYYNRYQDVLAQINQEIALAEQIRQYNEKMAEEKRQYNENLALQKAKFEEEKRQYNEQMALAKSKSSSSGGSSGGSKKSSSSSSKVKSSSKSSSSSSSNQVKNTSSGTVSPKQIIDLGYGPVNDQAVANLVRTGAVEVVTNKNGTKSLKKTSTAPKTLNNTTKKPTTTSLVKNLFPGMNISGKKANLPKTPQKKKK